MSPRITCLAVCAVWLGLAANGHASIDFEPYSAQSNLVGTTAGAEFGNGAAVFDYEGDGDQDLYVTDGDNRANRLYLNDGSFFFTEAPGAMGAAVAAESKGAAAVDYDNDGDPDLYVADWGGANHLFRHDGVAGYTDVTAAAGVGGGTLYSTGIAWADIDLDGDLDLYVANRGLTELGEPNQLFENQGDGTFLERGAALGINSQRMTFQPVFVDYDRDGDPDLHLANDRDTVNQLFRNDGGVFADVSVATGTDLPMDGMGNTVGDVNDDGWPDFYVTNTSQGNRCLVSQGDGTFVEEAGPLGIAVYEVGWGAMFLDIDLDGDEDLFEVNMFANPNKLFRNDGPGPWADISAAAGIEGSATSFGSTAGDFDGDGDLDLFVSNRNDLCEVYRNVTTGSGNWLEVDCQGVFSNRDGIGAVVEVTVGSDVQFREVRAGSSYLSQRSRIVHFGVGSATQVDRVAVRWPSGTLDERLDVAVNQRLHVLESATQAVGDAGAPAVDARLRLAPNPATRTSTVHMLLDRPGTVRVRLLDVQGRTLLVRELGGQPAGPFAWQLDAPPGLPQGQYLLEVTAPGRRFTDRITWVR